MSRIGGYLAGKMPANAKKRIAKSSRALPQKVDLRKFLTSIEEQVGNSCVANAMAGAYEYLAKRELGEASDVSRLFIYYNARYIDDSHDKDGGSYMEYAIKGLQEYGACSEELWANDYEYVNEEPPTEAYDQGSNFKIVEAEYIATDLDLWRETLSDGYPIAFALNTFKSFDDACKNKGRVSMPKNTDEERAEHGWHAMLCVGYSDIDKVFIVRNSWGEAWGDKGYCYIPYNYVINQEYNAHDSWIIKSVENLDYSEGVEVEDDDSYFYDEGYLVINDFYVYTEDADAFAEDLEKLILEYVESEEYFYFDYETDKDDGGEYILLNEFYLYTEDEEGFLSDLEDLAIEYGGEDGYDYSIEGEDEEEEDEEEDEEEEDEEEEDEEEEDEDEEDEDEEEEEDEDEEEEDEDEEEEEEDEEEEESKKKKKK